MSSACFAFSDRPTPGAFARIATTFFLIGAFLTAPGFAQVVINEILQNPAAVPDGDGEWFEVFNPTGSAIDINGWTIEDNDFDSHVISNGGPLLVPAGGFLVLGNNGNSATNGGVAVDYVFSGHFLANGGDELVLLDGTMTEIDRVEWDGGPAFPDPNGASMSLISPGLDNNVGAHWCTASTAFGDGDFGTPGGANDCPAPDIVINEIMQNPSAVSDSAGEWFEVFNPGVIDVDINGWTVEDNDFDSHTIANGGPLLVPAGGFLVLSNNSDSGTNGGVTVAYEYSGVFLGNGSDELVLRDTSSAQVDRVEWDDGASFPDPSGASMSLIAPSLDNNIGGNWCTASTPFTSGDLGTPGAVNDCPIEMLVINEIMQNPSAVSDSAGEWFEVFNATAAAIDIDGWTIKDDDFDSHVILNGGPLLVPAGGFLVLSNNGDFGTNGGVTVDYEYSGVFLANGFDELVLLDPSMVEVDRVEWDNGATFPDPNGASMSLVNPGLDNNLGENWCESSTLFGDGDLGTPGATNDCPFGLVINEIDYDQPGTDSGEFIEIKNVASSAKDLAGVTLALINGFDGLGYDTFPLPAIALGSGDYFVVCESAADVPNCDLEVLSSIQNGMPDAVALIFGGLVVDTVSYEGDTMAPFTEGSGVGLEDSGAPGQDFKGIGRFPDGRDTNQNNADLINTCITPGRPNSVLDSGCTPTAPSLEIYEVQGSAASSPFEGQAVALLGDVVTALGLDGFFIQTPTASTDGDIDTSDGIFVFTNAAPTVAVGDRVDVTGNVVEFFGFTEVSGSPDVAVTGSSPVPAPVVFDAAVPSPDPTAPSCAIEFECYEGMLIDVADGTVSGPNQRFFTDTVAEVHITSAPLRTFREPGIVFPGLAGLPIWDGNPEVFELDPDKLGLPNTIIPAGSSFSAKGVLGFEFGGYELWPSELTIDAATIPLAVPARAAGEITVATLNLFRLFDDVNDPPSMDAQGGTRNDFVVSNAEYLRRRAKFALYIVDVLDAPDILAVQEAEKIEVLQDLAADIALLAPGVSYTAFLEEGNDPGTIDTGFLVRSGIIVDGVTQLGKSETFVDPTDNSVDILHDRPPLLLDVRVPEDDDDFLKMAVMALHNRSLNGIDSPSDGPRVRQKRFEQARSIALKIGDLTKNNKNKRKKMVVLGDFNAFQFNPFFDHFLCYDMLYFRIPYYILHPLFRNIWFKSYICTSCFYYC